MQHCCISPNKSCLCAFFFRVASPTMTLGQGLILHALLPVSEFRFDQQSALSVNEPLRAILTSVYGACAKLLAILDPFSQKSFLSILHSPFLPPSSPSFAANMSNLNNTSDTVSQSSAPLGLPAPSDVPTSTEPNNVIKLDHLGPMVVNSDGTISRIANWQNLSDIEKERSLKLLAKRNNTRMDSLKFKQAQ